MTMWIDPRAGSCDLVEPMKRYGVEVIDDEQLPSGDVAFWGRGQGGKPVYVGVEYKKLGDYLSSMKGRLQAVQLPAMVKTFDRRYLLVEGEWEHDAKGRLLRRAGRAFWKPVLGAPPAAEVMKRMLTMESRGGISTWLTPTARQTHLWLLCLYRFWTDKDMDEHKSHLSIAPDLDPSLSEEKTWFQEACERFPGVGLERAKSFVTEFGGMENLMAASLQEIASVETKGRKFGRAAAERVYKELHK